MARNFCTDRAEIVADLRQKLAATAPKQGSGRSPLPTGLAAVDEALSGGLPRGRIVEVAGTAGRMSLAVSTLAQATRQGMQGAFIDPAGALDVQALSDQGAVLPLVLWVRPGSAEDALQAADLILDMGGFGLVVLYLAGLAPPRRRDQAWPRLLSRCERSGTTLLVASDQGLAGSSSALALRCEVAWADWLGAPGQRRVLCGRTLHVEVVRNRLGLSGDAGTTRLEK